jgi:hypothetical protein
MFKNLFGKIKLKFQKKYLAFFTLVPILAATAFIQVPCPVCGGTAIFPTPHAPSIYDMPTFLYWSHSGSGMFNTSL